MNYSFPVKTKRNNLEWVTSALVTLYTVELIRLF